MNKPIQLALSKYISHPDHDVIEYTLIIDPDFPISWNDIWDQFPKLEGFLTISIPEKNLSYATVFSIRSNKIGPLPDFIMNAPIKSMILREYGINSNSEVEIILDPSCVPEGVKE